MKFVWLLLCVYALWPLYVFAMAILKAKVEGKMSMLTWCLAFPVVVMAIALDIILNYTVFAVLLWDFPQTGEITFSQRLERLVRENNWRAPVARWIAEKLLDPYDHTGKHIK